MSESLRLQTATQLNGRDGVPRFFHRLLCEEKPFRVVTAPVAMNRLGYASSPKGMTVAVPIDAETRRRLDEVEVFVKANVEVPQELKCRQRAVQAYKPLYRGDVMNLRFDEYAAIFVQLPNQFLDIKTYRDCPQFGEQSYTFNIYVDCVYVGPHKDGSLVSIILGVGSICINC